MSLTGLRLSYSILTELYRRSLVSLDTEPILPANDATKISYLGGNSKNITVIIADQLHAFLAEDQLSFLVKMLGACQLNIGDVAIVNHARTPILFADLTLQFKPSFILLLGVSPSAIGMTDNDRLFKVQPFDGGVFVQAPSLQELNSNAEDAKPFKTKLWACLKELFSI